MWISWIPRLHPWRNWRDDFAPSFWHGQAIEKNCTPYCKTGYQWWNLPDRGAGYDGHWISIQWRCISLSVTFLLGKVTKTVFPGFAQSCASRFQRVVHTARPCTGWTQISSMKFAPLPSCDARRSTREFHRKARDLPCSRLVTADLKENFRVNQPWTVD